MCGITGYIGYRDAYPIIIQGLQRLEYRGYDSAGVVLYDDQDINLSKTKGKVSDLEKKVRKDISIRGNIGFGHTRWATHGVPNHTNFTSSCISIWRFSDCAQRNYLKTTIPLKKNSFQEVIIFKVIPIQKS